MLRINACRPTVAWGDRRVYIFNGDECKGRWFVDDHRFEPAGSTFGEATVESVVRRGVWLSPEACPRSWELEKSVYVRWLKELAVVEGL